jgi:hypothetical protein
MPINLTDRQKELLRQLVARKDELYGHPFNVVPLGGEKPGYSIPQLPGGPIFEFKDFNEYIKVGLLDQVRQGSHSSYSSYTLTNLGEAAVANDFQETGTLVTDLQAIVKKLRSNLNSLREREAKFGGNTPVELLNEIDDHKKAAGLIHQVIDATTELQQELESLTIDPDLKARLISILGEK